MSRARKIGDEGVRIWYREAVGEENQLVLKMSLENVHFFGHQTSNAENMAQIGGSDENVARAMC